MAAYEYNTSETFSVRSFTTKEEHTDTYPAISPTAHPLPPGRAVLVTGASRGIGRAISIAFAQAGASHIGIGARGSLDATKDAMLAAAKAAG